MILSQCGQIFNPWEQQILLGFFFSFSKSSLTSYELSPREEEYLRPDHVMVIVTIYPGPSSLIMGRLKRRSHHSDQQTPSGAAARVGQP